MSLTNRTRLGPYEILAAIGAGGMGEVYRARDTKLNREVAIKVLPEPVATDPERLARFRREAQVLAALNHPNIAHIHGFEESTGVHALVMELVEGPTLADRIERGPIPVLEALAIAKQTAEALEAAHEQGIIHRDLKPANIKVREDGTVKVLDFGLAKALEPPDALRLTAGGLTQSPTITTPAMMTGVGVILGTAAYMSPEQAKGRPADKRSDVWAFGCVLFEMLTAARAFGGEDVAETMAAVIRSEPDWGSLPTSTTEPIRRLLRRCLAKDQRRRLRDIGDARNEIEDAGSEPAALPALRRGRVLGAWAGGVLVLTAVVAISMAFVRRPSAAMATVRFTILPPEKLTYLAAPVFHSLSPDGSRIAFITQDEQGRTLLWVRSLDSLTAQALPGTEAADNQPFWSPDGQFIGFFAQGKLKKIAVSGGPPQVLCDVRRPAGGTWNAQGVILFGGNGLVHRIPASGGAPVAVTTLDLSRQEQSHLGPQFLPDGRHFLYHVLRSQGERDLLVRSLDAKDVRVLASGELGNALYSPPGYLVFGRDQTLMAQSFDAERLQLTSNAFPIADHLTDPSQSAPGYSVSRNTLTYRAGRKLVTNQLRWFDRSGRSSEIAGPQPGNYQALDLSADGKRVVFTRLQENDLGKGNLWMFDWTRSVDTRLTFESVLDANPVWSPDGSHVAFRSTRDGMSALYQKTGGGTGPEEVLMTHPGGLFPSQWSFDGQFIVFTQGESKSSLNDDIWLLPTSGDRKAIPFVQSKFSERHGQLSPDGRWIAYSSNESGTFQIYVQPFPATGSKWQVSAGGGSHPRWNSNGKELFYLSGDGKLMAAVIRLAGSNFETDAPKELFQTAVALAAGGLQGVVNNNNMYSVAPDGQRFLMLITPQERDTAPITVVVNWQSALEAREKR